MSKQIKIKTNAMQTPAATGQVHAMMSFANENQQFTPRLADRGQMRFQGQAARFSTSLPLVGDTPSCPRTVEARLSLPIYNIPTTPPQALPWMRRESEPKADLQAVVPDALATITLAADPIHNFVRGGVGARAPSCLRAEWTTRMQ